MSTSSAILKLIMLLTMDFLTIKSATPPTTVSREDKIDRSTLREKYLGSIARFVALPILTPTIIVFSTLTSDILSATTRICPETEQLDTSPTHLSLSFITSFVIIMIGSFIRLLCIKSLGQFFTFQLTIRPNHKIIDSGPYSIVRHASYTGAIMTIIGNVLLLLSVGSSVTVCGWTMSSSSVKVVMASFFIWGAFVWFWMVKRVELEEKNLRSHFGRAWDDYAKRVPYRFIPGVC